MVFPVVGGALVECAVLLLSNLGRVTSLQRLGLVELLVLDLCLLHRSKGKRVDR